MKVLALCVVLALLPGCAARRTERVPSAASVPVSAARLQVARASLAVKEPEIQTALKRADAALETAAVHVTALQREAEKQAERGRFWRAWTLRLSGLCVVMGVWIFRKPLMMVAGL